ncbi:MAG: fumarate hydratase C-terminal domain-containing protein [Syntrophaceticus schinkii]
MIDAIKKHGAVYLAATGGAGALIGRCIKEMKVVTYPDLGHEAVYRIIVENFPVTVAIDSRGDDFSYKSGGYAQYRRRLHRGRFLAHFCNNVIAKARHALLL